MLNNPQDFLYAVYWTENINPIVSQVSQDFKLDNVNNEMYFLNYDKNLSANLMYDGSSTFYRFVRMRGASNLLYKTILNNNSFTSNALKNVN